jgi:F-type H+-transporting ATPase subunit b
MFVMLRRLWFIMPCLLLGLGSLQAQEHAPAGHAPPLSPQAEQPQGVEHSPNKEGPNLLGIQAELGIWTLVVFVLLCLILRKAAWKPMLEGLHKREQNILSAIEDAKRARQEADALRQQFQAEMAKVHEQAAAIVEKARQDAKQLTEKMIAEARADIQEERERLHRDLQTAKDQALQELWNQTAQLATMIASKAVQRQLSVDDHRRLVDESLAELSQRSGDWKRQRVAGAVL